VSGSVGFVYYACSFHLPLFTFECACLRAVCVCADEAGNNVQVVMLHRTQRAVFEIATHMDEIRSVIPPLLLHIHDTLYTGMVRKAQDCVIGALPVSLWPKRPHAEDGSSGGARNIGDSLDGCVRVRVSLCACVRACVCLIAAYMNICILSCMHAYIHTCRHEYVQHTYVQHTYMRALYA
jgi:hypothetical protein